MKSLIIISALLAATFLPISHAVWAQADSIRPTTEKEIEVEQWAPAEKVQWSEVDEHPVAPQPGEEGELAGLEALQKNPEYTRREARRVKKDTARADKQDRQAARAAEKPRRIKN